jgi:hypothetical protein
LLIVSVEFFVQLNIAVAGKEAISLALFGVSGKLIRYQPLYCVDAVLSTNLVLKLTTAVSTYQSFVSG